MRSALHEENDTAELFKAAAVELCFKGLLYKDERTKQWLKDPPSISESYRTLSESNKEEVIVLYDAPGEMDEELVSASRNLPFLTFFRLPHMGRNPGTPHGAALRLTDTGVLGQSGCSLHDADQGMTMTFTSLPEYQEINSSFDKPCVAGRGNGRGT